MGGKKRILLTASAIILLCLTILVGATLGLFSDGVTVHNHLQAGDLEADLVRTNLKYVVLNAQGQLQEYNNGSTVNLSNTTHPKFNIFGLDSEDIRIAPLSYFEADLEIRNEGNVAFDYTVKLAFTGDATKAENKALAEQLLVTITHKGTTIKSEVPLINFVEAGTNYVLFSDLLLADITKDFTAADFTVKISFKNDNNINNFAQIGTVTFDLIVEAVQSATIVKGP